MVILFENLEFFNIKSHKLKKCNIKDCDILNTDYYYYIDSNKHDINNITVLPTIPNPISFRDAYAFREHVANARKNRDAEMIAEFDQFPVFYFSNHNAMFGDGQEIELMPDHFHRLDYELEFAIVIGTGGKNILSKDADNHIAGFCILNDLSARRLQM